MVQSISVQVCAHLPQMSIVPRRELGQDDYDVVLQVYSDLPSGISSLNDPHRRWGNLGPERPSSRVSDSHWRTMAVQRKESFGQGCLGKTLLRIRSIVQDVYCPSMSSVGSGGTPQVDLTAVGPDRVKSDAMNLLRLWVRMRSRVADLAVLPRQI